jgi:hypothetical protein
MWSGQVVQLHSCHQLQQPYCTTSSSLPSSKQSFSGNFTHIQYSNMYLGNERGYTFKLSTVEPTNSMDLYVAPATEISPIICTIE